MIAYPMTTGRNFDMRRFGVIQLQLTAKDCVATPVNWKKGDDVIIAGSVTNDEAKKIYPQGWKEPKPEHPHRPDSLGDRLERGSPAAKPPLVRSRQSPSGREAFARLARLDASHPVLGSNDAHPSSRKKRSRSLTQPPTRCSNTCASAVTATSPSKSHELLSVGGDEVTLAAEI